MVQQTRGKGSGAVTRWAFAVVVGALICTVLAGCYQSFGVPPGAECVSDTECPAGFECSAARMCVCSPSRCAGCCTADRSDCRGGQDDTACGTGGEACEDCTSRDKRCVLGACVLDECDEACDLPGQRECTGSNTWHECGDLDGDGCLGWSADASCPNEEVCSGDGVCRPPCDSQCSPDGGRECSDAHSWRECGDADGDGCLDWLEATRCGDGEVCDEGRCVEVCGDGPPCSDGEICVDGVCVPGCRNDCTTAGVTECISRMEYRECGQHDTDECLEWGPDLSCAPGEPCDGGGCVPCVPQCEAGDQQCAPSRDAYLECEDTYGDGCTEWSDSYPCADGEECVDGRCTDRCDVIGCEPGFTCVDGECVSDCTPECTEEGLTRCSGRSAVETCVWDATHTCLIWSEAAPCPTAPSFCFSGDCSYRIGPVDADGFVHVYRPDGLDCPLEVETDGRELIDISMGDVDGDGGIEVLVLTQPTETGSSHLDIYSITCAPELSEDTDVGAYLVMELADLTHDGVLDIVLAGRQRGSAPYTARVVGRRVRGGWGSVFSTNVTGFAPFRYVQVVTSPEYIRATTGAGGSGAEHCVDYRGSGYPCP